MGRKINVNLFNRFQDSLKLDLSDGQTASLIEGVQPVVDISPQIQDSYTSSQSGTTPITLTWACPDGKSINIKRITHFMGPLGSGGSRVLTLNTATGPFVLRSLSTLDNSGWWYEEVDLWVNAGETLILAGDDGSGSPTGLQLDIYGLQYFGVK